MNHLEEAILEIIKNKYHKIYNAGIKVTKTPDGFKLRLDLGVKEKPLVIFLDTDSEEKFLKFIKKELVERQLQRATYFIGVKKEIEDELRGTCIENRCNNK